MQEAIDFLKERLNSAKTQRFTENPGDTEIGSIEYVIEILEHQKEISK